MRLLMELLFWVAQLWLALNSCLAHLPKGHPMGLPASFWVCLKRTHYRTLYTALILVAPNHLNWLEAGLPHLE
jgi:hypothetical protein